MIGPVTNPGLPGGLEEAGLDEGAGHSPGPHDGPSSARRENAGPSPALLYVATVSATIAQFIVPYAVHLRSLGWRVDAAARSDRWDEVLDGTFDRRFALPWSRSMRDAVALAPAVSDMIEILGRGYDIVHVHTPIAAFATRLAISRMDPAVRPALIYTAHGFHFHRGGGTVSNTIFLAMEKAAGRWTDRLVVINDEDEQAARRHRLVPDDRIVRMPGIGIDTGYYARSALPAGAVASGRSGLRVPPTAPMFAVIGELNRGKRPNDVLVALRLMGHSEAHVAFLGAGPERDRLVRRARFMGVLDRVRFPGFVTDPRPVIAGATAVILASSREGLARSVMEALALETPVIASTARGNAELVGGGSGFLFDIGDTGTLAARMDWLIDHPEERDAMGRTGRARMVERYDLHRLIHLHDALYADVLSSRPSHAHGGASDARAPREDTGEWSSPPSTVNENAMDTRPARS